MIYEIAIQSFGPIVDLWWMERWRWYGWAFPNHLFSFVYRTCYNFGSLVFQFGLVVQIFGSFLKSSNICSICDMKIMVLILFCFWFGLIGFILIWFLFKSILVDYDRWLNTDKVFLSKKTLRRWHHIENGNAEIKIHSNFEYLRFVLNYQ